MVEFFCGLGSNIGVREENIKKALRRLAAAEGVVINEVAPLYETAPVGYTEQPDFLNTVARGQTKLAPTELLTLFLALEDQLGRRRTIHWGPRVIDIDLLLYEGVELATPQLTVPHPRLHERAFVMVPLADLAPDLVIKGRKAAELAEELAAAQSIRRYGDPPVWF